MATNNPWTEITLANYEGHISLPAVGQAQMLDAVFGQNLKAYAPESVAVLGCAGGTGFERLVGSLLKRVAPAVLRAHAGNAGYVEETGKIIAPGTGKEFYLGRFRRVRS